MKFMLPCRFGEKFEHLPGGCYPDEDSCLSENPFFVDKLQTLEFLGGFSDICDYLNEVYIVVFHESIPCRPRFRYQEYSAKNPEWAKKFPEYWFKEPRYEIDIPDWLFHDFDLSWIAPYVSGIGHLSNANYHADGRLHYRFLGKKLKSPVITTSDVIDRYFAEVLPPVSQPMYYYFYEEATDNKTLRGQRTDHAVPVGGASERQVPRA